MADLIEPVGPPAEEDPPRSLREKVFWFLVLALSGTIAVASAAYLLRALLFID